MDNAHQIAPPDDDTAVLGTAAAPPEAGHPPTDFRTALAYYTDAITGWVQLPDGYTNEQSDAVAERVELAREALFACPASTLSDLLEKLKVAETMDFSRQDQMALIMADAKRLLGRRRIYGTWAGIDASLLFAATDWSRHTLAARTATSEVGVDEALDATDRLLPLIEAHRAQTAADLEVKLRVICCDYYGMKPGHNGEWPKPTFTEEAVIPARVMRGLFEDVEILARRSETMDRSHIVEAVARDVDSKASNILLSLLYSASLVRAISAEVEGGVMIYTSSQWLPSEITQSLRETGNDLTNLLYLLADQIEGAKEAAEAIQTAGLVSLSKEGVQ